MSQQDVVDTWRDLPLTHTITAVASLAAQCLCRSTQPPTDHKAQQQQLLLSHLEWEACIHAVPGAN